MKKLMIQRISFMLFVRITLDQDKNQDGQSSTYDPSEHETKPNCCCHASPQMISTNRMTAIARNARNKYMLPSSSIINVQLHQLIHELCPLWPNTVHNEYHVLLKISYPACSATFCFEACAFLSGTLTHRSLPFLVQVFED